MSALREVPALRRALAAAGAVALLGLSVSACGGDDSGSSSSGSQTASGEAASGAASTEEFCTAYNRLSESLLGGVEKGATQDEQASQAAGVFRDWADQISEVGLPEDAPDDVRAGFDVIVQTAQDLPDDVSAADFKDLQSSLSEEENTAADAFGSYATETCPTELPSDLPTELPSDLPTEDLPTELPSDLPTEGLPTELPSQ